VKFEGKPQLSIISLNVFFFLEFISDFSFLENLQAFQIRQKISYYFLSQKEQVFKGIVR